MSMNLSVKDANVASEPFESTVSENQTDIGGFTSDTTATKSDFVDNGLVSQKIGRTPIDNFLQRWTRIQQVPISNADARMSFVFRGLDPWAALMSNASIDEKTKNFKCIRGSIEMMVVTSVPGNCYGKYVITGVPYGGDGRFTPNATLPNFAIQQCMNTDYYCVIDVASPENVIMKIPFIWPNDYAELPNGAIGSFLVDLICLMDVTSAIPSGVTTGYLTFYARFTEDLTLSVPFPQGKDEVRLGKVKEDSMRPKPSESVSLISRGFDGLGHIPIIGSLASSLSKGTNVVANVLSAFGFSRSVEVSMPHSVKMRGFANVTNLDVTDTSEICALASDNAISIDPTINCAASGEDELAFPSLFKRWTIISDTLWAPAATLGSIVDRAYVAPLYTQYYSSGLWPLTTGGYVGFPFQNWRGDMEYRLDIICSNLHRASLQLVWIPAGTTTPGASADITNLSYNQIIDISGPKVVHFRVGYQHCNIVCDNTLIQGELIAPDVNCYNGSILMIVNNPITVTNGTASISLVLSARCGSNMQFVNLRDSYEAWDAAGVSLGDFPINGSITLQGLDDDTNSEAIFELVPSSGPYPIGEILTGEHFNSVRPLMQKPYVAFDNVISANYTRISYLRGLISAASCNFSLAQYYRVLFTCIAGSERYKVIINDSTNINLFAMGPLIRPVLTSSNQPFLSLSNLVPSTIDKGGEFSIPYYGVQKFVKAYCGYTITSASPRTSGFVGITSTGTFSTPASATTSTSFFYSMGDDLRLSCFRYTPQLLIPQTGAGVVLPATKI